MMGRPFPEDVQKRIFAFLPLATWPHVVHAAANHPLAHRRMQRQFDAHQCLYYVDNIPSAVVRESILTHLKRGHRWADLRSEHAILSNVRITFDDNDRATGAHRDVHLPSKAWPISSSHGDFVIRSNGTPSPVLFHHWRPTHVYNRPPFDVAFSFLDRDCATFGVYSLGRTYWKPQLLCFRTQDAAFNRAFSLPLPWASTI